MKKETQKLDEEKSLSSKILQGDNFELSDEERQNAEKIQREQESLAAKQQLERMKELIDYKR